MTGGIVFVRGSTDESHLVHDGIISVINIMRHTKLQTVLGTILAAVVILVAVPAAETPLPGAKPVPDMQVLPQPYDQASFEHLGRELTRYHFGPQLRRPFWYPIVGPSGRSLTRMIDQQWETFASSELASMTATPRKE